VLCQLAERPPALASPFPPTVWSESVRSAGHHFRGRNEDRLPEAFRLKPCLRRGFLLERPALLYTSTLRCGPPLLFKRWIGSLDKHKKTGPQGDR